MSHQKVWFFKIKKLNLGHLLFELVTRQIKKKVTFPSESSQNMQFREKLAFSSILEVYPLTTQSTARLHLVSAGLRQTCSSPQTEQGF